MAVLSVGPLSARLTLCTAEAMRALFYFTHAQVARMRGPVAVSFC